MRFKLGQWYEIDGFLTHEAASIVETYVKNVPDNGWIIEVGCFKGRQSNFIANKKKESVLLSCIDPFPDNLVHFDDSRTYQNYMFGDWTTNMTGFKNVEPVRGLSPFKISHISFTKQPNLIIFDVDNIIESLIFWHAHLSKNSVILVHTYNYEHSRIVLQVEVFANQYGYQYSQDGMVAILSRTSVKAN